jgi:GT2 family glycosyltransferase
LINNLLVVIVTFNSEKWINKNLNSVYNQELFLDVLVIDNKSTDNTVSILEDSFPHIKLIKSSENIGFSAANNIGFLYALKEGYKYVFLLNHDAWLAPNSLNQLIKCSGEDNFDILSPMHLNGTGTDWDYGFKRFMPNLPSPLNFITNQNSFEVDKINGAFMLITSNALKALKGFDPLFFFYGEDDDFCIRAKKLGFKIGVVTHSFAYHDRQDRIDSPERNFQYIKASLLIQVIHGKERFFVFLIPKIFYSMILFNNKLGLKYLVKMMSYFMKNIFNIYKSWKLSK